jgi:putative FmdB family regulatory protein
MPTYEYGCEACGTSWELEQRISEAPVKECPKCGELKAKRLISGGNFLLKGGGWYADGYGSSSKGGKKSESSEPKAETKSESKSEKASPASSSDD